ncbi:uncharacterized protein V1518DRAFT_415379 [Limtongia smithiae]|uniref:uncharacterized protein n=1 Tax=Limtongia smithiae TaxID=1125753 RepID=UPI0034CF664C
MAAAMVASALLYSQSLMTQLLRRKALLLVIVLVLLLLSVIGMRSPDLSVSMGDQLLATDETFVAKTSTFKIGSCVDTRAVSSKAIVLGSASANEELTMTRFRFHKFDTSHYYNPSLLPALPDSPFDYVGFVRYDRLSAREVHWCYMNWTITTGSGRSFLDCIETAKILPTPHFPSIKGSCEKFKHYENDFGLMDPRVFWSPFGEPLMIVITNSHMACLGQYLIDVRVLVPELSKVFKIEHVPIRYSIYTELNDASSPYSMFHKNWFLLYDDNNRGFLSHGMHPQIITEVPNGLVNIAADNVDCLHNIIYGASSAEIHQGTNSLRLTLCDFPCVPTVENTVLISIVHAKYMNYPDMFYRRFLVLMEPVAPFRVIARTRNLIYAGADVSNILFSFSLTWDTTVRTHGSWREFDSLPASAPSTSSTSSTKSEGKLVKRAELAGKPAAAKPNAVARAVPAAAKPKSLPKPIARAPAAAPPSKAAAKHDKPVAAGAKTNAENDGPHVRPEPAPWQHMKDADQMMDKMPFPYNNTLVSDWYHGWLDDTIIISFGMGDMFAGFFQVKARDIVNCLIKCDAMP